MKRLPRPTQTTVKTKLKRTIVPAWRSCRLIVALSDAHLAGQENKQRDRKYMYAPVERIQERVQRARNIEKIQDV